MKGVIEFANRKTGRYAVRTDAGRFTIFQVLSAGAALSVDETVRGELEALSLEIYDTAKHGRIRVFAEETDCTRSTAKAWVGQS